MLTPPRIILSYNTAQSRFRVPSSVPNTDHPRCQPVGARTRSIGYLSYILHYKRARARSSRTTVYNNNMIIIIMVITSDARARPGCKYRRGHPLQPVAPTLPGPRRTDVLILNCERFKPPVLMDCTRVSSVRRLCI